MKSDCPLCDQSFPTMNALVAHLLLPGSPCARRKIDGVTLRVRDDLSGVRCWCEWLFDHATATYNWHTSFAAHLIECGGLAQHILDLTFPQPKEGRHG